MRKWKIALGAAVALGAISVARPPARHGQSQPPRRHGRGGDPRRRRSPCRCRWSTSSRRRCRSISTIRPAPRRSAASRCRPRCRLSAGAGAADGADVRQGDLLYRIDSARLPGGARPGEGRRSQRDTATLDYARSNLDRGTELAKSGYLAKDSVRPAHQHLARGRGGARHGSGRDPHGRAQSELYRDPRAVRRTPRPQPGLGRHAGQRRRHGAQHAGAARPDLRHLQSERDGSGADRGSQGGRADRGRGPAPRRHANRARRASSPSSTTLSTTRPAPSPRAPPSATPSSRCCPANMSACACTSGNSPMR